MVADRLDHPATHIRKILSSGNEPTPVTTKCYPILIFNL